MAKIRRNEYLAKLYKLTSAWPVERAAVHALTELPFDAYVAWFDRNKGDPWPANAPWKADTMWAKMALIEENDGADLAHACNFIMLGELQKGNQKPLAQWLSAGWAPSASVLLHLAGWLSEEDARTNAAGEKIGVRSGRKSGTRISKLVRDHTIAKRFRTLLDARPGDYTMISEEVGAEFNVSDATARAAYDSYIKRTPRPNAKD